MATDKESHVSTDRKKWQKIFNALVHMLQSQQTQVESLAKERKLLEDRIKFQYDRWLSDVHSLQDQIAQMGTDFKLQEKEHLVEAAKSDLLMGLKTREISLCKLKLENTDSELEDFKVLIDFLSHKSLEPKDDDLGISKGVAGKKGREGETTKEEEQRAKKLEGGVRKLKREYESLASKNSAKVSALLAEQNFVWNQYKIMESNYTNKLNSKRAEVEQANEKIDNLLAGMQQLESLNNEKDDKIVKLKTDLAEMEIETKKKNEEISRLSKEVELLRKSRSALVTPILNPCTEKQKTHSLEGKNIGIVKLKTDLAEMEIETKKKNEEISRLSKEVELLRKSRSALVTPILNCCTEKQKTHSLEGKNIGRHRRSIFVKKELPASEKTLIQFSARKKDSSSSEENTEKKSRGSKRKQIDVTPTSNTPMLFTSTFRIPKLKKNSSPQKCNI